jgi:hypothetical protein
MNGKNLYPVQEGAYSGMAPPLESSAPAFDQPPPYQSFSTANEQTNNYNNNKGMQNFQPHSNNPTYIVQNPMNNYVPYQQQPTIIIAQQQFGRNSQSATW